MRRILSFALGFLTFTSLCYGQAARNASPQSITHSRTNFTNVGITGLDVQGNPGYIAMANVSDIATGYQTEYYLWVGDTGNLCIASWPVIQAFSSFPNGNWSVSGIPCSRVGAQ